MNNENNDKKIFENNIPYPRNNLFAILSFIFGIASVLCCCLWYIAIFSSIFSIVFFIVDRKKNLSSTNLSIAALICAVAGFILTLATFISNNFLYEQVAEFYSSLYEKL